MTKKISPADQRFQIAQIKFNQDQQHAAEHSIQCKIKIFITQDFTSR